MYLLDTYFVLNTGDRTMSKMDVIPAMMGSTLPWETDTKGRV